MLKNLAKHYGIEGGNFDTELLTDKSKTETTVLEAEQSAAPATPDASGDTELTTDETPVVEPSSTVKIDVQEQPGRPDMEPRKLMVFLGGTCNESSWRDKLVEGLTCAYFNPVVQDWKPEDKEKENQIKDAADINLFVFTPKHTGFFSFVEASVNAVKFPSRTVLCVLDEDEGTAFEEDKKRSVHAIIETLSKEGIKVFDNLDDVRSYLNSKQSEQTVATGNTNSNLDAVSTEGLGKIFSKWKEGKSVGDLMGKKTQKDYIEDLKEIKQYIKENSWLKDSHLPSKTLRLNYIDLGFFTRDLKVVSDPVNELHKEIIFLMSISSKFFKDTVEYRKDHNQIIKELEAAKTGAEFNAVCNKWNAKKSTFPADQFLGKKHSFMNDVGTANIAFKKNGYSGIYSFPFWKNKQINQGDVTINGISDIKKMIEIVDLCDKHLNEIRNYLSKEECNGWSFDDDVFDNAIALDREIFRKMYVYISPDSTNEYAYNPLNGFEHYYGAVCHTIFRVLKEYKASK